MAIAYIIGNGPSRKQIALEKLDGVTFGCNALYRDFRPDYLIGGDAAIIKEICASGYPNDNLCIFPDWDPIPKEFKDTLLQPFKEQNYRIEESDLDNHDHIQIFGLSEDPAEDMQVHVLGVDINWNIINMRGTDDDPGFSVNFFTGAQAMAQASIMGFSKQFSGAGGYSIGFGIFSVIIVIIFISKHLSFTRRMTWLFAGVIGMIIGAGFFIQAILLTALIYLNLSYG